MSYRKTSEAIESGRTKSNKDMSGRTKSDKDNKVKWGWLGPYKDTSGMKKAMQKVAKKKGKK
jgi:hypothetical protein